MVGDDEPDPVEAGRDIKELETDEQVLSQRVALGAGNGDRSNSRSDSAVLLRSSSVSSTILFNRKFRNSCAS